MLGVNLKKNKPKRGELVKIVSKYPVRDVTIESIDDSDSYIDVPVGTIGLFLGIWNGKFYVSLNDFVGWVYEDECQRIDAI